MTATRASTSDQASEPASIKRHTINSAIATLMLHPLRVVLNRASVHQSPIATIKDAAPRMLKGVSTNFIRGTLAASTQVYAKTTGQHHGGFMAGVAASSFTGMVISSLMETRLIRKNQNPPHEKMTVPAWRFSVPLSSLYCLREVGFTMAVLAKNDLSPIFQYAALFSGAIITATTHKLAAAEAIRDMLPKEATVPNFRQGVLFTIKAMANGNVYTHDAFRVPFKNPSNLWMKAGNFMHVSCGPNMFVCRLIYLYAFREAYDFAVKTSPTLTNRLFNAAQQIPFTLSLEKPSGEPTLPTRLNQKN